MEFAVGFDYDHTLGVDNRLERTVALEMLAETARSLGLGYDESRASTEIEATLHAYRHGHVSVEDGLAAFFALMLPGHAVETVDASERFRDRVCDAAKGKIEALPGAAEMLAALDEMGIRYAILTNGWSPLQEMKARGLAFEGGVFVSERIGFRKPAREAFDVLVQHFGLPAGQVWYVGDDPEADIGGALASGLRAIWFDWEGRAYPAEVPPPTHRITRLDELAPFLQGRQSESAKSA